MVMLALIVVVLLILFLIGSSILNDPYRDDENNDEADCLREWNAAKKKYADASWHGDER